MRTTDTSDIKPAQVKSMMLREAMAATSGGGDARCACQEKASNLDQETINEADVQLVRKLLPVA